MTDATESPLDNVTSELIEHAPGATSSVLEDVMSGLIKRRPDAPGIYAPRLIANHPGNTMGDVIGEELENADSFDMSVAFISAEAVKSLFEDFKSSAERNGDASQRSHLITSTKNHFNTPAAFWDLLRLKHVTGVDVRIWNGGTNRATQPGAQGQPFHPKGYVFARHLEDGSPYYNLYVGSSNLTQTALSTQREWNLKVSSLEGGELVDQIQAEMESQLADSELLTEEWITRYEEDFQRYERELRYHAPSRRKLVEERERQQIEPNAMQREALASLEQLRADGEHSAIVISATGTKTYLSAFDVRQCNPRRMLYVAEREQILKNAMASYRKVLGCADDELGLLSGTSKHTDCRYVFAMAQTLSKPDVLERFAADEFEYILIDEAHHVGAERYQRILNHFTEPEFLLGMTATPERTDGYNIYSCFGHNIAYEIRLQRALDEDMLCPFHYYGVAEYLGEDGTRLTADDGNAGQLHYEIGQLASPERVRYIIDKIQTYTPYHQQITGLVFCSRVDEAAQLSELFNTQINQQTERTYRTIALSGDVSAEERERAVRRLEEGELDYIFTVNLFNEGIDIPSLNQIVMLRSTQSSIVFTQQLGRGLRKCKGKESVTVIDFIGNYANNYLIPVALYGNTGDRDVARRNLQRRSIGLSSISFDRIARERVLQALDRTDWSEMKKLGDHYRQLRYELARIPMLTDVYAYDPSLPMTMASKKIGSKGGDYLSFVRSRERSLSGGRNRGDGMAFLDQLEPVSETESAILKMATELLLPGLRPHELVILDELCRFGEERIGDVEENGDSWRPIGARSEVELAEAIAQRFPEAYLTAEQMCSALRVLDYSYFTATNRLRFGGTPLIELDDEGRRVRLSEAFCAMLSDNRTFRIFFADTIRCGLMVCREMFERARSRRRGFDRGFLYEQKYKLADVMRLLGWSDEMNGQNVGGYFCHKASGTMPIFVKYANSQYDDRFLGLQEMRYFSKNNRTEDSPEFQWMKYGYGTEAWQEDHFIPLFVMRKEESDEAKYYYVGHVAAVNDLHTITRKTEGDGGATVNLAVANLRLARPLGPELFRHLTGMATS